jgi:hypothetical protein
MLALRVDPWAPDHGMGFQAQVEESPAEADPFVETDDWTRPIAPLADVPPGPVWFVDGVRRVELRLLADDEDRRAPGLFGSFAVGSVRCDGRAAFDDHLIGRTVVVGGGLRPSRAEIRVGADRLSFEPSSQPGSDPDTPLWGLQQLMRRAEGTLAAKAAASDGGLVLVDGPLMFADPTSSPVVGVVKRFAQAYLPPQQDGLLPRLGAGERTPLFGLGESGDSFDRYAWYTRLVPLRRPWHDHAGIVRCEVRAGVGLPDAISLADRVSAMLPAFAGRPGDPRYPQNLAPVGGLEGWLTHRLGHRGIIRRALTEWLLGSLPTDENPPHETVGDEKGGAHA